MNCAEFGERLMELARGKPVPEADAHAAACPRCMAAWESQQSLTRGLRALAAESRGATAGPAVEARLLQAYRSGNLKHVRRSAPHVWYWAAALAAGVTVAIVTIPQKSPPPPPVPVAKVESAILPPVVPVRQAPPPAALKMVRKRRPKPPAPAELVTEFLPLPAAPQLEESEAAQVVRVRVPRSLMMTVGLPLPADSSWEPVKADVVFGQDGMARAIRFVK